MRKKFNDQPILGQTPIELVKIPQNSRDQLPPILRGLQWLYSRTTLRDDILSLLEERFAELADPTKGRPGMELWRILCLGVVRLGLACDYDRLEHTANYDLLVRGILGVAPAFGTEQEDHFNHRTLSLNVCHITDEVLAEINALVVKEGLGEFPGAGRPMAAKADSYVLETNVHYPTDANLLFDACRKACELCARAFEALELNGWRKLKYLVRGIKSAVRQFEKVASGGGADKEKRTKAAATHCLAVAEQLRLKIEASLAQLRLQPMVPGRPGFALLLLPEIEKFRDHLVRQADQLGRRILKGETIPHAEKVFSLFEEHTELIKKGKKRPSSEFGHRFLVTTNSDGLILDYKVMQGGCEVDEALPLGQRLVAAYGEGAVGSLSFDKGFSSAANKEALADLIPLVVMPKKGKKTAAEAEEEAAPKFSKLRDAHSAVESDINRLEHHGLDRCPDKGLRGYLRYAGLGVLAANLHAIGARLIEKKREEAERKERKAEAQSGGPAKLRPQAKAA